MEQRMSVEAHVWPLRPWVSFIGEKPQGTVSKEIPSRSCFEKQLLVFGSVTPPRSSGRTF
jgi:hypothetical protein